MNTMTTVNLRSRINLQTCFRVFCIWLSIISADGDTRSTLPENEVTNEIDAQLIFGKPIGMHNCSIAAILIGEKNIRLHEVSGSILQLKNMNKPEIPRDLCLYESAPDEATLAVIITQKERISGLLAFGFTSVLQIPDQSLPAEESSRIKLSDVHGEFDPAVKALKQKTLMVPERVIELYTVMDELMVDQRKNRSVDYVLQMVTLADLLLRPLRLHVTLVGLELWDLVPVKRVNDTDNLELIEDTYEQVLAYRQQNVSVPNSVLHLLSGKKFQLGRVGMSSRRGVCRDALSIILTTNSVRHTSLDAASILVHEFGHLLGLYHDQNVSAWCYCDGDSVCLMSGVSGARHAIRWSNCSMELLQTVLLRDNFPDCFKPIHFVERTTRAICGNWVHERGEECDDKNEARDGTTCCDHQTCKLRPSSQCSRGPCCLQCQLRKAGSRCTRFIDEPALLQAVAWYDKDCLTTPDNQGFCDGQSSQCSTSEPKPDGSKCDGNQGICIQGQCRSLDRQCKRVFGDQWQVASGRCFEENVKGIETAGYCDYRVQLGRSEEIANYTYQPCLWQDTKCGLLHCRAPEHQSEPPNLSGPGYEWGPLIYAQTMTITSTVAKMGITRNTTCTHGLSERKLTGMRDPGLVADGTPCGVQQFCQNGQCLKNAQWSGMED